MMYPKKHTQILAAFLLTISCTAQAKIYTWVDENGNTQFSDKKPTQAGSVKQVKVGPVNSSKPMDVPDKDDDNFYHEEALDAQNKRQLNSEAQSWAGQNCRTRFVWNNPVDDPSGETSGHSRSIEHVCKASIPSKYRPFLSEYKFDKGLYNGQ